VNNINEITFASYRRGLRSRNRSEKTIESYAKGMRELDRFLGGADITSVSKIELEKFFEKRLTEVSGTSRAIVFRSLRAFFNWCVQEEIIPTSPMNGMTEPKSDAKPVGVLSDDDLRALIKACAGKSMVAKRDEALIRILCEPGSPRLGELAAMLVPDVDLKRDMITVTGKTGTRTLPFGSKTGTAVDRYLRLRAKHPQAACPELWVGLKGPLSPSGIVQMLERRSIAAGLGRINPHRLRHTSASHFLENDGNEGDAVVLFGWVDATMIHKVYGRSAAVQRAHKAARRMSLGDRL
jgi:site-specific recombinase XerD